MPTRFLFGLLVFVVVPFSHGEDKGTTGPWQQRKWQTQPATLDGGTIRAELPEGRPLVYFLTVTDDRKATVSTEHEVLDK